MRMLFATTFGLIASMAMALTACVGPMKTQAASPPVQVYAAGSLRGALTAIVVDYEKQTGQSIQLTFGASGLMRERIEKGEHVQVFASADTAHPAKLAASGGWQQPQVFVRNTLCALAKDKLVVSSETLLDVMLNPSIRVGSSTPIADPSGDYSWALFRKAETVKPGSYAALDAKALKLTGGPDSPPPPAGKGAYAWTMESNRADLFLLYCTNAVSTVKEVPALKLQIIEIPDNLKIGAAYAFTVSTTASQEAQAFAQQLLSAKAQATFKSYGFGAP